MHKCCEQHSCMRYYYWKQSAMQDWESDLHLAIPKTADPQYRPIVKDQKEARPAQWKKALALLFKPASSTPLNTGLSRSFHRDIEKEIRVMRYCRSCIAKRLISLPMSDQSTMCSPHWHIWQGKIAIESGHWVMPNIIQNMFHISCSHTEPYSLLKWYGPLTLLTPQICLSKTKYNIILKNCYYKNYMLCMTVFKFALLLISSLTCFAYSISVWRIECLLICWWLTLACHI